METIADIKILTNTGVKQDFIYNAIVNKTICNSSVKIASAFFTDHESINELVRQNNKIELIVRLGYPTLPAALRQVFNNNSVSVRFFTSSKFHPKLYIYDSFVLVGSANLTHSALTVNQEIILKIDASNPVYQELNAVFEAYWTSAEALTEDYLRKYEKHFKDHSHISDKGEEQGVEKTLGGKFEYKNITIVRNDARSKQQIAVSAFRKDYQDCCDAFFELLAKYKSFGKRHTASESLPIKLEFDSFFSWVYDKKASGKKWQNQVPSENLDNYFEECFNEWITVEYNALERTRKSYPRVNALFSSKNSILSTDFETMSNTLLSLHSVHTRQRFFKGGLASYVIEFQQTNTENKVKDSLAHLFFGAGDIVERMYDLIYQSEYKLNQFGESNVQELVGWVDEGFPIMNKRTTKMLHYFGCNVRQIID